MERTSIVKIKKSYLRLERISHQFQYWYWCTPVIFKQPRKSFLKEHYVLKKQIDRLEDVIAAAPSLSPVKKQQLIGLVADLHTEVTGLSETHAHDAGSIQGFTSASIHEAIKSDIDDDVLAHAIEGMQLSVRKFEVSHPRLVGIINVIVQTLSGAGI